MKAALSIISAELEAASLGHEAAFLRRVYDQGLGQYTGRLRAIGFHGQGLVLDAGAGFGQWSLALAAMNGEVHACDLAAHRVEAVKKLAEAAGLKNLRPRTADLTDLPYEDGFFDAVFCFSAIIYTDWLKALAELHRVLKTGGRLYVQVNGFGFHAFLWMEEHNKTAGYSPREHVCRALRATLDYQAGRGFEGGEIIIEPRTLTEALESRGFAVIGAGGDGSVHIDTTAPAPRPLTRALYQGLTASHEAVAEKL